MNISSAAGNLESLILVANALEELCNDLLFVGGSVTGLLITDTAAPDVRFTVDIDCIVNVITKSNYYGFAKKLRKKGFKEMPFGDHPICRWSCHGLLVDIVPVDKNVLGFSNVWYKDAFSHAMIKKIKESINIKIISAPYFIATKLEAFKERGKQDFLLSHDMEDIISILDGRPEIITDITCVSDILKKYLAREFSSFIDNQAFMQALPGHLNYSSELESRKKIVLERIQAIIELEKSA